MPGKHIRSVTQLKTPFWISKMRSAYLQMMTEKAHN